MKFKYLFILCLWAASLQNAFADGSSFRELHGRPYLENCSEGMAVIERKNGPAEAFVELASTPEKMLQLIHDYDLVFSKGFSAALQNYLLNEKILQPAAPVQSFRKLNHLSTLPRDQFIPFLWQIVDSAVEIKVRSHKEDSRNQVAFLQAKTFVQSIRTSPHKRLFEDIVEVMLRTSLISAARAIAKANQDGRAETLMFKESLRPAFIAQFFPILAGVTWDLFHFLFIGHNNWGLGTLVGFGGEIVFLPICGEVAKKYANRKDEALMAQLESHEKATAMTFSMESSGKTISVASQSIFSFLEKELEHGVLSLEEGCKNSICDLTPIQVAYLGHVEVLELEALHMNLKQAMIEIISDKDLEKIHDAAQAVYKNPADYARQMALHQVLSSLQKKARAIADSRNTMVESITSYVQKVTVVLKTLQEKPYKQKPETPQETIKNQMLLAKIQGDIATLSDIRINSEAMAQKIQGAIDTIVKVESMVSSMPSGPDGWQEMAENILLRLDELR